MNRTPEYEKLDGFYDNTLLYITPHKHNRNRNSSNLWHEQLEIKLYFSDGDELVIGDEVFTSRRGDIYIINPYEPHSVTAATPDSDYHMIIIDVSKMAIISDNSVLDILGGIQTGETVFNRRICNNESLSLLIEELVNTYVKTNGKTDLRLYGLTFLIFQELINNESSVDKLKLPRQTELKYIRKLAPALRIINSEFTENINVAQLAKTCNVNVKYFSTLFRALTGNTVSEYVHKLRADKAEALLTTTDMQITDIAYKCGYSEVSHFCRKYKKLKNETPLQSRKRHVFPPE